MNIDRETHFMDRTDAEMDAAFRRLAVQVSQPLDGPTFTGRDGTAWGCEVWQYMGTAWDGPTARWVHQFRNRMDISAGGERRYVNVTAAPGWRDNPRRELPQDRERDYGGAFDGFTVTSDADPGL